MFDIRFSGSAVEGSRLGNGVSRGRLVIGEQIEEFESFIGFWSPFDYERQWLEGTVRVAAKGSASCLITSLTDPSHAEFVRWWLLYPQGDLVVLQEGLLLLKSLVVPFSTTSPYDSIPEHQSLTDDGRPISEWRLPRTAIADFARRRNRPQ